MCFGRSSSMVAVYLLLFVALSGCISNGDAEEASTLIEVPFVGPVDERECFEFDSKERCWLLHILSLIHI